MTSLAGTDNASPSGQPPSRPPIRAADADRSATVRVLQDAVARGLLTPDEAGERMATAFAAVHLQELGGLTADLPPAPPTSSPPGWRLLAAMAVEQLRSSLSSAATGRLAPARVAVALLLAVLFVVALGFLATELLFDGGGGPGPGDFGRG